MSSTAAATTTGTMISPPQPQVTMPATTSSQARLMGMRRFHPRSISWS